MWACVRSLPCWSKVMSNNCLPLAAIHAMLCNATSGCRASRNTNGTASRTASHLASGIVSGSTNSTIMRSQASSSTTSNNDWCSNSAHVTCKATGGLAKPKIQKHFGARMQLDLNVNRRLAKSTRGSRRRHPSGHSKTTRSTNGQYYYLYCAVACRLSALCVGCNPKAMIQDGPTGIQECTTIAPNEAPACMHNV